MLVLRSQLVTGNFVNAQVSFRISASSLFTKPLAYSALLTAPSQKNYFSAPQNTDPSGIIIGKLTTPPLFVFGNRLTLSSLSLLRCRSFSRRDRRDWFLDFYRRDKSSSICILQRFERSRYEWSSFDRCCRWFTSWSLQG